MKYRNPIMLPARIRIAAIKARIPYITIVAAGKAAAEGIHEVKAHGCGNIKSLQSYHGEK